ncbi:MAG TPA: response regulator transcription factor [Candidatus Dormibacteraeota bacterium]|nr:response regulator transcription factor [Candidatus Dormibacteraeota bacterium]
MTGEATVDEERIRVVLVDDHDMVAESFRRILATTTDIDVLAVAGTAAAAVEAARVHRPDVIVMDHHLPDGRGSAAAARIRAELPDVRIVVLTGTDDPDALAEAFAAGCVGYFEKTSAFDELPAAIRAAAAGGAVISPRHLDRLRQRERVSAPAGAQLTPREREVLLLVSEALPNATIAARLSLSVNTVRTHVQVILEKLGAHSRLEAVTVARRRGLLGD